MIGAVGVLVALAVVGAGLWFTRDDGSAGPTPSAAGPSGSASRAVAPVSAPSRARDLDAERLAGGSAGVDLYEIPVVRSAPRGITVAPDGTVWITLQSAGSVARLGQPGASLPMTVFDVPETGSNPFTPVVDPDGELWFTDYSMNSVTHLSDDGTMDFYVLPFGDGGPLGLAFGADSTWWITDAPQRALMRMQGSTVTGYPPTDETSTPYRLAAGSGAVWATDPGANAILRIAPDGSIDTLEVPTPDANPYSIAAVGDEVWFTEQDAGAVGRIAADGEIEEFPLPGGAGTLPSSIAIAGDGSVWVTDGAVPRILHLAPDGSVIDEVALPKAAATLDGIAAAPDGAVWAVAVDGNVVVRIDPAASAT